MSGRSRTRYVLRCVRRRCHTFMALDGADLNVNELPTCVRCGWPMEIVRAEIIP